MSVRRVGEVQLLHRAKFYALLDVIPRLPHAGRRCLACSMRCRGRHKRCPWCGHVPDVLDDRCDVLSRLRTVGRTGARQYLDSRLVQLPALRPRVVRAHSERTTRRFGSRRGLRAERGEQSAALALHFAALSALPRRPQIVRNRIPEVSRVRPRPSPDTVSPRYAGAPNRTDCASWPCRRWRCGLKMVS